MSATMDPEAVLDRLRNQAQRTDLRAERRMHVKLDYSPAAVERRLRDQSMLAAACRRFAGARTFSQPA